MALTSIPDIYSLTLGPRIHYLHTFTFPSPAHGSETTHLLYDCHLMGLWQLQLGACFLSGGSLQPPLFFQVVMLWYFKSGFPCGVGRKKPRHPPSPLSSRRGSDSGYNVPAVPSRKIYCGFSFHQMIPVSRLWKMPLLFETPAWGDEVPAGAPESWSPYAQLIGFSIPPSNITCI